MCLYYALTFCVCAILTVAEMCFFFFSLQGCREHQKWIGTSGKFNLTSLSSCENTHTHSPDTPSVLILMNLLQSALSACSPGGEGSHVGRSSLMQVLIQLFTVIRSAYLSRLSAPLQDSFLPSFLLVLIEPSRSPLPSTIRGPASPPPAGLLGRSLKV